MRGQGRRELKFVYSSDKLLDTLTRTRLAPGLVTEQTAESDMVRRAEVGDLLRWLPERKYGHLDCKVDVFASTAHVGMLMTRRNKERVFMIQVAGYSEGQVCREVES